MKVKTPLFFRVLAWFAIIVLCVLAYAVWWQHFQPTNRISLTTHCEEGGVMRLLFSDNRDFEGAEPLTIWCTGGLPEEHSIPLGDAPIRYVKILPPYTLRSFTLSDVELHCDVLKRTQKLDLGEFQQTHVEQANETASGGMQLIYQNHPGHATLRLRLAETFPARLKSGDRIFYLLLAASISLTLWLLWRLAHSAPMAMPVAASVLVLIMAMSSKFNVHPDEWSHLTAAAYYFEHDWFPLVDSPELERFTIPWCGISYAQLNDLTYPLAGKFIRFSTPGYTPEFIDQLPTTKIGGTDGWGWLRARWFHFGSFLLLLAVIFWAKRRELRTTAVFAFMLIFTPQLWYVFSYYNGDAFGFFLSCLPAILIVSQQDKLFGWLDLQRGKMTQGFLRMPLFWLLTLAIFFVYFAKKNYLICLPFYCLLLAIIAFERFGFRWRILVRALMPAVVGVFAILLFAGVEHYRHDFRREARILEYWNEHGVEAWQPKNVGKPFFNKEMMLRSQGVGLDELVQDTKWWRMIYLSSFGGYGGMNIWAPTLVYWLYAGLTLAFLFSWFWLVNGRRRRLLPLLLGLSFCFVALAQALSYSWLIAYQPQGRYLLPILPMMAAALGVSLRHSAIPLVQHFSAPVFALSCYSFAMVALPALTDL